MLFSSSALGWTPSTFPPLTPSKENRLYQWFDGRGGVEGKQQSQVYDLVWTSRLLAILRLSLCGFVRNFRCDWMIFSWGKFCLKLYIYFYKNLALIYTFSKVGSGENKPQIILWSSGSTGTKVILRKYGPISCSFYYYILNKLFCCLLCWLWIWNTPEKRGKIKKTTSMNQCMGNR